MPIRAVLFDLTSTLIELAEDVGSVYSRIAAQHGARLPGWRLDDAFRRVLRHLPPRVAPGLTPEQTAAHERGWWREAVRQTFQAADSSVRFDDFDAFFSDAYAYYERAEAWRLLAEVRPTLLAIRTSGRRTGLVSNFDHRLLQILKTLEIEDLFDVVMFPGRCGAAKPDPAIFDAALSALGVTAAEALYVGHDPQNDLEAAAAAGLATCDVTALENIAELLTRLDPPATLRSPGRSASNPLSASQERNPDE